MDWLITLAASVVLFVLLAPVLALLATIFILVPLAHLAPLPTTVARKSFDCPLTKRRVSAAFLTPPDSAGPTDVLDCSVFGAGQVRCKKGCLELLTVGWAPSPMVPRCALIAGGQAYR